jgi:hypothetical protein
MTELVVVDINVLVYSRDTSEPAKQPAAMTRMTDGHVARVR